MSYRDYLNETQGLRVNRGGGFRVDDLDYFQVTNSKDSDHPTQTWGALGFRTFLNPRQPTEHRPSRR